MNQHDDFSDVNPFRALSRAQFRPATARADVERRRIHHTRGTAARPASEEEDRQLFLAALGAEGDGTVPQTDGSAGGEHVPEASRQVQGAFLLEERRAFKKMRRKQAAAASAAPVVQKAPPLPEIQKDSDDAEALFAGAMRGVQPLEGKGRDIPPRLPVPERAARAAQSLQDMLEGHLEFALTMSGEYLEGYVVGLDAMIMNKLRAGQYSPEAYLDLHGLTAAQAFHALVGFFRGAWYKGMRTLLVVPGRGRNSPDGIGVLRAKLQDWLTQEPFKRVVLAFCSAKPSDGGAGSVYILLRKYRKKGKICWERLPADPDLF